eukprot:XP_011665332.1 PREDICTED: toll-like receptor 2 [Strongylocentrotus purpuratus]
MVALTAKRQLLAGLVLSQYGGGGRGGRVTLRRDSLLTPSAFDRESLGCELNIELKTASCGNRGLNSVPQNLSNDILRFDLFRNNITYLLSWSFKRYPLITRLDLSRNDIRVIERTALHPLKDLMYLDISFNPHLVLPGTGFLRWASKLSTLNLQSSNLQLLPNDILKWSPRLESVQLHRNHLKVMYVNLSKTQIEHNADAFNLVCHVGYLDLLGNPILSVDPDVIASLHVRTLIIGDYPVTFESFRDLFSGISHSEIKEILITNASITAFPDNFFDPLRDWPIHILEFSNNEVKVLYPFVFSILTKVYELSFQDDYISRIEPDYFEGMLDLRVLRVEYNQLKDINIAAICFVVAVGFVFHNRWQIRFKLYLLKLAVLGYNELRDARDHNDYEFDLNIIFYDDDEHWIREQLQPAFGERLPQFERNVFGDDDLVLGMHYLDSVDYVVSRSYKTVIVLSRAAVRDRWFMLKFRIAMDHVSDTQTEFVVVVFVEEIPDDEIPFLARLYLSDGRPYFHWPNDERRQKYFWNRLVKSLTINLRTNDLIPNE